jgi:hypothetical protein
MTMNRAAMHAGCILGVLCFTALAQAPGGRPPDKPASPASLPGDTLPPFGMLDGSGKLVPQPQSTAVAVTKGNGVAPRRGPVSTRGPKMSLAIEAARTAVEVCAGSGFYIGASVIDTSGQPRAMVESDGSDGGHVYVAVRKALVALTFKMPSSRAGEVVRTDPALLARSRPTCL